MRFFRKNGKVQKIDDYHSGKIVYGHTRGEAYHTLEEGKKLNEQRWGYQNNKHKLSNETKEILDKHSAEKTHALPPPKSKKGGAGIY